MDTLSCAISRSVLKAALLCVHRVVKPPKFRSCFFPFSYGRGTST